MLNLTALPESRVNEDSPLPQQEPARASAASMVAGQPASELYCPFPSRVHSRVEEVNLRTVAWARVMGLIQTDAQTDKLLAQKMGWLVARAFPQGRVEALQVAADWMTLFCVLDDRIEKLRSSARADAYINSVLEAFNPAVGQPVPADPCERAMRDLSRRIRRLGSDAVAARFEARLRELYDFVLVEAANRSSGDSPGVVAYSRMREVTIGLHPFFILWELAEGITLPEEVLEHPALCSLRARTKNLVGWANDYFTYPKELLEAEVHNIVLVVMNECRLTVREAAVVVGQLHDAHVRDFIAEEQHLPSFGALDSEVLRYTEMLRCWIRGHLDWARETGRYAAAPESTSATDLTA